MQTEELKIRLTRADKELIGRLAEHEGRSRASLIRRLVAEKAAAVGLLTEKRAAA